MKRYRLQSAIAVLLVAVIGVMLLLRSHAATASLGLEPENGTKTGLAAITDTTASNGQAVKFAAGASPPGSCQLTALLVNPCRPWLGAYSGNYKADANGDPVASGSKEQLLFWEKRAKRQLDVAHMYNSAGDNTLGADAKYFINRSDTLVDQNWKPAAQWADGTGCGSAACDKADAGIDDMADSIKSVAPHKIFLTLYHEPENNVAASSGACAIQGDNPNGVAGTAANFVAMWHNVRARFNAKGVNNVVWTLQLMEEDGKFACLVKPLWPGNNYVDWVVYDPYAFQTKTWQQNISYFYNWMTANSDADHDFLSKQWGLGEFGTFNMQPASVYDFWQGAKTALDNNTFPRMKMYLDFDSIGPRGDERLLFNNDGAVDQTEQTNFNAWANDPKINGDWTAPWL